jgi:hypothetical protein
MSENLCLDTIMHAALPKEIAASFVVETVPPQREVPGRDQLATIFLECCGSRNILAFMALNLLCQRRWLDSLGLGPMEILVQALSY